MGDIAHGGLNLLALLAKLLACAGHHQADHRQNRNQHQRQHPVHPQKVGKQEDNRHALAEHHLDRVGSRAGDHGDVEGNARDQVTRVVQIKIAIGQGEQIVE